jgi:hypothetical protein
MTTGGTGLKGMANRATALGRPAHHQLARSGRHMPAGGIPRGPRALPYLDIACPSISLKSLALLRMQLKLHRDARRRVRQ